MMTLAGTLNVSGQVTDKDRSAADDEERRQAGRNASTRDDNPAAGNAAAILSLTTDSVSFPLSSPFPSLFNSHEPLLQAFLLFHA